MTKKDWLKSNSATGWEIILNKTKNTVNRALEETNTKKVDLIGHSSGGVMLRLFLSNESFNNKIYDGKSITKNLITLGSPHQAIKATSLRKLVDKKYPGNFFKNINYVSVGGSIEVNSQETYCITKLLAKFSYKSISGENNAKGDGLVPLSSSLLKGSKHIILPKTYHGSLFGKDWYGSSSKVKEWWDQIIWQ